MHEILDLGGVFPTRNCRTAYSIRFAAAGRDLARNMYPLPEFHLRGWRFVGKISDTVTLDKLGYVVAQVL